MSPEIKHQIFQSLAQFVIVFVSGMGIYKDWSAVQAIGLMNAVWQPLIQSVLSVGLIYGVSKAVPKP